MKLLPSCTWRVGGKLLAWERPLRRSDLEALGDAAPDGPILAVYVPLATAAALRELLTNAWGVRAPAKKPTRARASTRGRKRAPARKPSR